MKKHTLRTVLSFALLAAMLCGMIPAAVAATDSTPSSWAQEWVDLAESIGLIPKDFDISYQRPVTRAEFCHLAVNYMTVEYRKSIDDILKEKNLSITENPFTDTSDPVIIAAKKLGIVAGTSDTAFSPGNSLTREQGATMLCSLARVLGYDLDAPAATFPDYGAISDYAQKPADFVLANDIMVGDANGRFDPKGGFTQEQALITFCKFYNNYEEASGPDGGDEDAQSWAVENVTSTATFEVNIDFGSWGAYSVSDKSVSKRDSGKVLTEGVYTVLFDGDKQTEEYASYTAGDRVFSKESGAWKETTGQNQGSDDYDGDDGSGWEFGDFEASTKGNILTETYKILNFDLNAFFGADDAFGSVTVQEATITYVVDLESDTVLSTEIKASFTTRIQVMRGDGTMTFTIVYSDYGTTVVNTPAGVESLLNK